jgi:hypothetical protein
VSSSRSTRPTGSSSPGAGPATPSSHPAPPGVVITLIEEDGGTRVVLRHHGLPDDAQRDHHRKGWERYLSRLAVGTTGGDPGPDPNA